METERGRSFLVAVQWIETQKHGGNRVGNSTEMTDMNVSRSPDIRLIVGKTFVADVEWLLEVDSTNSYIARGDVHEHLLPWLVVAEQQTSGRGRERNRWWSAAGALTFSLAIRPNELDLPSAKWPLLSLAIGLAVRNSLEMGYGLADVRVKWPNDVYANQKKICGILIETHPRDPRALIIGIGLNVKNSMQNAPDEIRKVATSMIDESGRDAAATDVLSAILTSIEHQIDLLSKQSSVVIDCHREHCYLSGKLITLNAGATEVCGHCLGIDDDGALRIQTEMGVQRFHAGSVKLPDD